MAATAKSVALLTSGRKEGESVSEVLNMGRPATSEGMANEPREHGQIKKRRSAAQVRPDAANEEKLPHKLKPLIVKALPLFK